MADAVVASHIVKSNLPRAEKRAILGFLGGAGRRIRHFGGRAMSFGLSTHRSAPVSTAIGVATGGVLGLLHVKLPQGLDIKGKAPADLIAAAGATLLAMGAGHFGGSTIHHHAKTIAIAAGATFGFRKTVDLASEMERRRGRTPGYQNKVRGSMGPAVASHHGEEDPLAAFARTL
jgi:hypothetical protein